MQPIPFGKYLLVERLAQGGMAEVFRAVYQGAAGFEKQVAVKRILPVFDGTKDFVAMFVDEARIASSLTHVNIVQVSDFGLIVVTRKRVKQSLERVLSIADQVCVLDSGAVAWTGSASEARGNPEILDAYMGGAH